MPKYKLLSMYSLHPTKRPFLASQGKISGVKMTKMPLIIGKGSNGDR